MQRYSYKLLKFSELEGPYRGVSHTDNDLEERVNRQLDDQAEQGWRVKTFSVDYVGGRVIYTVLLEREADGTSAMLPGVINEKSLSDNGIGNGKEDARTRPIPMPMPERSDVRPRRVIDTTAELRPIQPGPTIGERAAEIRRMIESTKGIEYYRKALDVFDASLRARMEQERTPAEAIALRALKQREKQNEPTFQFALCWLSEHGHSDRPLSTILPELGGDVNNRPNPQQAHLDRMASRFDLPDNREAGQPRLPSRFNR